MSAALAAAFGNSYPADPRSGAGIRIVTSRGLTWKAQLDYGSVAFSAVAPTTGTLVAQMADGAFVAFDISSLPLSPQFIAALLSGAVPEGYPPRRSQFLRALEAAGPGRNAQLLDALPLDPGHPTRIAWDNATWVSEAGPVAQFVKTTLGLGNDDIKFISQAARSLSD